MKTYDLEQKGVAWYAAQSDNKSAIWQAYENGSDTIIADGLNAANASLIAAAPELLKALIYCESAMEHGNSEDQDYACKQARGAIAKTRGK